MKRLEKNAWEKVFNSKVLGRAREIKTARKQDHLQEVFLSGYPGSPFWY